MKILFSMVLIVAVGGFAWIIGRPYLPWVHHPHVNVVGGGATPREALALLADGVSDQDIRKLMSVVYFPGKCGAVEAIGLDVRREADIDYFLSHHHLPAWSRSFAARAFRPGDPNYYAAVRRDWDAYMPPHRTRLLLYLDLMRGAAITLHQDTATATYAMLDAQGDPVADPTQVNQLSLVKRDGRWYVHNFSCNSYR